MRHSVMNLLILLGAGCLFIPCVHAGPLRIATFNVDATPPIGSPVAYALTRKIVDPLIARGIVLLSEDRPIVLCAVDWIGISNSAHDLWQEKLAQAAGTSTDRVAVHTLHQHDDPVAVLTYYATHPMSHYGQGDVSADFVGLARAMREVQLPGPLHIHFNGANGNITAGKYNDGSEKMLETR